MSRCVNICRTRQEYGEVLKEQVAERKVEIHQQKIKLAEKKIAELQRQRQEEVINSVYIFIVIIRKKSHYLKTTH